MERALITAVHVACDSRRGGCRVLCSVASPSSAVPRERVNETSRRGVRAGGGCAACGFLCAGLLCCLRRLVMSPLHSCFAVRCILKVACL